MVNASSLAIVCAIVSIAACAGPATRGPSARAIAVAAPASPTASSPRSAALIAADDLHRSAIVVDTHNDVTRRLALEDADLTRPYPDAQTDLPRMREGGVKAVFLSVWVPPELYPGETAYAYSLAQFEAIDRLVSRSAGAAVLARTASDIRNAASTKKIALLIGVEGAHGLGDVPDDQTIARLRDFRARGARYMTLTWSTSNRVGGSSGDAGKTRGLTPFGARVVRVMNEIGIIVDVSHVSDPTFFDVMKLSTKPVLASHSSARAICDHPRNMTDDMLRAVRDNGGAVCVNFGQDFLDQAWHDQWAELQKSLGPTVRDIAKEHPGDPRAMQLAFIPKYRALAAELPRVPASRAIDHIEHIARVAGIDHVCLGSDFDGIPLGPAGLDDVSKFPFITEELSRRGFSADDIRKVLGENVLRVLAENEKSP